MHNCKIKMKDGRNYCSPMWEWRPKDGYFTILNEAGGAPITVNLAEVETAEQLGTRTSVDATSVNVDLLARAKAEGWEESRDTG